jgi:hypothetical protein
VYGPLIFIQRKEIVVRPVPEVVAHSYSGSWDYIRFFGEVATQENKSSGRCGVFSNLLPDIRLDEVAFINEKSEAKARSRDTVLPQTDFRFRVCKEGVAL